MSLLAVLFLGQRFCLGRLQLEDQVNGANALRGKIAGDSLEMLAYNLIITLRLRKLIL